MCGGVCVCSEGRGCRETPVPPAWDHVGRQHPSRVVATLGASKAPPKAALGLKPGCHEEERRGLAWEGARRGVSRWFALAGLRPAVSHLRSGSFVSSRPLQRRNSAKPVPAAKRPPRPFKHKVARVSRKPLLRKGK